MTIYGYHHPNGDGRLFLSSSRPKIVGTKGGNAAVESHDEIGWIDGGAKKLKVKPGEYVKFKLVKSTAKRMAVIDD